MFIIYNPLKITDFKLTINYKCLYFTLLKLSSFHYNSHPINYSVSPVTNFPNGPGSVPRAWWIFIYLFLCTPTKKKIWVLIPQNALTSVLSSNPKFLFSIMARILFSPMLFHFHPIRIPFFRLSSFGARTYPEILSLYCIGNTVYLNGNIEEELKRYKLLIKACNAITAEILYNFPPHSKRQIIQYYKKTPF